MFLYNLAGKLFGRDNLHVPAYPPGKVFVLPCSARRPAT